jgi:hypothetical protein
MLKMASPRPAWRVSLRPHLSKGWSSPSSPCSLCCAWVRVAPVPASPLLTGCGRSDNPTFAGTGRGTGFPVRTRNWQGRKEERGLARGCKGQPHSQPETIQSVSIFFLQAPARRSCDGLDCLALPSGRDKEGLSNPLFLESIFLSATGRRDARRRDLIPFQRPPTGRTGRTAPSKLDLCTQRCIS